MGAEPETGAVAVGAGYEIPLRFGAPVGEAPPVALAEALAPPPPPPPAAPLVAVGARVVAPDAHALAERHAEGEAQPVAVAVVEGLPEGERLPCGERDTEAHTERDAEVLT